MTSCHRRFSLRRQSEKQKSRFNLSCFSSLIFFFVAVLKLRIELRSYLRSLCNVLIRVTASRIVHAVPLPRGVSACSAVSEVNWVLRFRAPESTYVLIIALYSVMRWNCCFHLRGSGGIRVAISPAAFTYSGRISRMVDKDNALMLPVAPGEPALLN